MTTSRAKCHHKGWHSKEQRKDNPQDRRKTLVSPSSSSKHSNPPDLTSSVSRATLLYPIILFVYADETLKAMASQPCSSSYLIVSDLDLCRQFPRTLDLYRDQPAHMKACTKCTTDLPTRKMCAIRGCSPRGRFCRGQDFLCAQSSPSLHSAILSCYHL